MHGTLMAIVKSRSGFSERLVKWCVTLYWYREIVRGQGDADVHDESHIFVFICVTVWGEEREERQVRMRVGTGGKGFSLV
jgi:hypothetical protein